MKITYRIAISTLIITLVTLLPGVSSSAYAQDQKTSTTDQSRESAPDRADVERFIRALQEIKTYYVKPVSDKKLFEDAIRGMVNGLDPHSDYLDAQDLRDLKDTTSGEFSGLGMEVTLENGFIKVISPIDDTPAQKGGVKPGDLIVKLDDTPTKGLSLTDAINRMRGKKGSSIVLTILRKDQDKPITIKLVREDIHVHSIKARMLDGGYGYIRITTFSSNTAPDMKKSITDLTTQNHGQLKGLILDLRNNPGGLLDSAIDVSNAFLNSHAAHGGLIVYTKGRVPSSQFKANATGSDMLNGAPMVVLINEGSASGAEIVAGALQDQKRAILLGTTTFGKGSVQTVLPLDDTTAIKLTTALYYTPSGRSIQAEGIKPDVEVNPLKVSANNNDEEKLERINESELAGHLLNADKNADHNISATTAAQDEALAESDYQLSEALNLLKGLVVIDNRDINKK
jgi:carboxyl-terminal processing protease